MFFKKKKGKTPKTSNRKVVPNMKPIEELRTNKDVAEWCRDFLRITDELSPELAIADRAERNYLMALVGFLVEWCPRKDLSLESLHSIHPAYPARKKGTLPDARPFPIRGRYTCRPHRYTLHAQSSARSGSS